MSVTPSDFQPINSWKPDINGPKWRGSKEPMYLIDETTDRRYWNESEGCVGFKCFLLTFGTPFVHPFSLIVNMAYRILKLVTFSHFWVDKEGETKYDFKARLADAGKDLLKIVVTPLSLVGLELAAIYGIFSPYDGRKLYASIERATYGGCILAPCFQPDPKYHALGGDPTQQNAF